MENQIRWIHGWRRRLLLHILILILIIILIIIIIIIILASPQTEIFLIRAGP
jgi:type IV secretory pathway component VirB8